MLKMIELMWHIVDSVKKDKGQCIIHLLTHVGCRSTSDMNCKNYKKMLTNNNIIGMSGVSCMNTWYKLVYCS